MCLAISSHQSHSLSKPDCAAAEDTDPCENNDDPIARAIGELSMPLYTQLQQTGRDRARDYCTYASSGGKEGEGGASIEVPVAAIGSADDGYAARP